jgi:hypothetical protein
MKKTTFLLIAVFFSMQLFGVALKIIESTKITFHNFSANPYDMAGHILTIDANQYMINNMTILSGSLSTVGGDYVEMELPASANAASGSIALWAPGTNFPNPSYALMVDFVQWGAGGQEYETQAVNAGRWAVGAFVNASLPIARSNNYGSWGASEWASSVGLDEKALEAMVQVGPVPFDTEINMSFEQGHSFNEVFVFNMLGELVYTQKLMQHTASLKLNTAELKSGVYLIEIKSNNRVGIVKRLVKR